MSFHLSQTLVLDVIWQLNHPLPGAHKNMLGKLIHWIPSLFLILMLKEVRNALQEGSDAMWVKSIPIRWQYWALLPQQQCRDAVSQDLAFYKNVIFSELMLVKSVTHGSPLSRLYTAQTLAAQASSHCLANIPQPGKGGTTSRGQGIPSPCPFSPWSLHWGR